MLLRVIFKKSRKVKIKEYKDCKIYYSLKSGFKTRKISLDFKCKKPLKKN